MAELPRQAQVIVIGGGIVGASIAYHLGKLGVGDVLLLERDRYTCGTTWHAAGLVGQLRATENLTRLCRYSLDLYAGLEAETGQATGFRQPGAISLATTEERFHELKRTAAVAAHLGVEAAVLSPAEAQALFPRMEIDDVVGAVHLPKDGMVSPVDVTMALLAGARQSGVATFQGVPVDGLLVEGGRTVGVITAQGEVRGESVVLAAGMWSREFAARYGVPLPLHAAEHYYAITQPIEGLSEKTPILRDPNHCAYFKEDARRLLVGLFEPVARPWAMDGVPDVSFAEIPADLDHVTPLLERAYRRLPFLHDVELRQLFCGPESFTPDDNFILGEAPTLPGLFVAAGFNSIGIQAAGGVGKALAEWIVEGEATMDLAEVDIRRFEPFHAGRRFLAHRTVETLGLLYGMHWPFRQYDTARGVKHSPFHTRLAAKGACFGETAGWERPNFYAPKGEKAEYRYSYARQNFFPWTAEEHRATREGVGLYDQTSYAKFLLQGPEAESVLQRVSAADLATPMGKVVYTQWLNASGGIEADLTVTRIDEEIFLVVTTAATRFRDFHFLKAAIGGAQAILTDVTSGLATLGIMGPDSRELLGRVTSADLSNASFPFATSQEIELDYGLVRAMRITYVGELGWELYIPTEFALHVFDAIMREGEALNLKLCGFHAMASCRLEKGYRHWGHDIGPEDSPLEAGLGFAVGWAKDANFVGREALEAQKKRGLERRLLQFQIHDPEVMLYHDEPIYRDGERMGLTTSGGWGHTLGAAVAMGYAKGEPGSLNANWIRSGEWEIEVAGKRYPASASLRPSYDPASQRVRG
ncbi:MAG TPA: FAD-dependent oxidoreductase [Myxococcales bacterium]|nr:FAD-dependent oxidoreductase [Myxococcales bacterium]HIL02504.1 FAD-dependent oxidoreductase [Myxococcales bacterium]